MSTNFSLPPPTYVPSTCCDFREMRAAVYYHLYPRAESDEELSTALDAASGKLMASIELEEKTEDVPPHIRPSPASLADPGRRGLAQHYRAEVGPPSLTNQELVRLNDEIAASNAVKAAIENGEFDPLKSLILRLQMPSELMSSMDKAGGFEDFLSVPSSAAALGYTRWCEMQHTMRDHLYHGRLTVRYIVPEGFLKSENREMWLLDGPANEALMSGSLGAFTKMKYGDASLFDPRMLFERGQVAKLFPPYSYATATTSKARRGRPDKKSRAEALLIEKYPDGRPGSKTIKEFRDEIEKGLGKSVSESTVKNALKSAWQS